MLASPFPSSFLGTYGLSVSSLGCSALCIVISFLVLWSICLSSSLVHLRKGPEYLTRVIAQVFIPLIRFLLESFVLSSFLVLLRYSFEFCLSFPLVWWCQSPRFLSICRSRFLRTFWSYLELVVLFRQLDAVCHFSWRAERIFQCQIPFLCLDCIFCLYKGFQLIFIFANSFMSSMCIRWLIFSCDLLSLYPAVHFLSMWFSGIMAIMNCRGDIASPKKIPRWIFFSAKLFPPAVNLTLQLLLLSLLLFVFFWEFFTLALADGFSLEFEWQQVSSSLQDSSQYSSRSQ